MVVCLVDCWGLGQFLDLNETGGAEVLGPVGYGWGWIESLGLVVHFGESMVLQFLGPAGLGWGWITPQLL